MGCLVFGGLVGFFVGRWIGREEGKEEEAAKWKQKGEWQVTKGERHEQKRNQVKKGNKKWLDLQKE